MKRITYLWGLPVLFLLACSSSEKIVPVTDGRQFNSENSMPRFTLSHFKSVQTRRNQDTGLALVTTISGGGTRAANFGMGIMLALEHLKYNDRNILQEIDYFSTVSGGGFAAGAYINSLYNFNLPRKNGPEPTYSLDSFYRTQLKASLNANYENSLIRGLLFGIFYHHINTDVALEKAVDDLLLGYKARSGRDKKSIVLGHIFKWESDSHAVVRYPYMVTNTTCFDNNAIVQFTPDVLRDLSISQFYHRYKKIGTFKTPLTNPRAMVVPLSLGIKSSGSFPVLIRHSTLFSPADSDNNYKYRYLRLVDGGVADNLGTTTAFSILHQEKTSRKSMIVIDAAQQEIPGVFAKKDKASVAEATGQQLNSGLDARYFTFFDNVKNECKNRNIRFVILNLSLLCNADFTLPGVKEINKKEAVAGLLKKYGTYEEIATMNASDKQILYLIASHVATKYSITIEEQEALILAGKTIVMQNKEALLGLLE